MKCLTILEKNRQNYKGGQMRFFKKNNTNQNISDRIDLRGKEIQLTESETNLLLFKEIIKEKQQKLDEWYNDKSARLEEDFKMKQAKIKRLLED